MKKFLTSRAPEYLLIAHAGLLPISIAAGQIWAYLFALLAVLAWCFGGLRGVSRSPLFRVIALFVIAAIFSLFVGVRPGLALKKLDRFLLLAVVLVLPLMEAAREPAAAGRLGRSLIRAFLAGCSVKALYDCVRIPITYLLQTRAFDAAMAAGTLPADALRPTIYDAGNMRDPQFYAVALCIAAALWLVRSPGYRRGFVFISLLSTGLAVLLHFKRGAWIAVALSLLTMMLMARRWRAIGLLLLLALLAGLLPPVRARVVQLNEEFQLRGGGRYGLWTRVAPNLYRQYPLGMGWRSVQHQDLLGFGAPVQKKLNHLHNNFMQVRLETGWFGVSAWILWMGSAFVLLFRSWRRAMREQSAWRGAALGLFGAFLALHLNGVVEYNFGDSEVFMLMNLLMGLGAAGWVMLTRAPINAPEFPGG